MKTTTRAKRARKVKPEDNVDHSPLFRTEVADWSRRQREIFGVLTDAITDDDYKDPDHPDTAEWVLLAGAAHARVGGYIATVDDVLRTSLRVGLITPDLDVVHHRVTELGSVHDGDVSVELPLPEWLPHSACDGWGSAHWRALRILVSRVAHDDRAEEDDPDTRADHQIGWAINIARVHPMTAESAAMAAAGRLLDRTMTTYHRSRYTIRRGVDADAVWSYAAAREGKDISGCVVPAVTGHQK